MTEFENVQNLYEDGVDQEDGERRPYAELARELALHDGLVVGVLDDPHFAGKETPSGLRFRHIAEAWGAIPGVRVVPLDANQIRSHAILFKGRMDILVFPYGSVYPMEAYGFYSGQSFNYFLKHGGAVLTTGGIPFAHQASPSGKIVASDTPENMTEVFDKWISRFGIKYYQCRVPPAREQADADLLPELATSNFWAPSATGVVVMNSAHEPVPRPPAGNVFPERTPARTILPLMRGYDRWGQEVCTSAVLAQDFENGSRRIHFTHEDAAHPLSPDAPHFPKLMQALFELLRNRVFVKDVEADYACYRPGETVSVTAELVSFEQAAAPVTVVLEIVDAEGTVVHRAEVATVVDPNGRSKHDWTWRPERFAADEYAVRIFLRRGGRTISGADNGFVVWNPEVLSPGPRFGKQGCFFTINDTPAFITGTNYCESTRGGAMWFRPNVLNIIRDYRRMQECGVNMVRPHYHHRKWFRDYLLYHHGRLPGFYCELEGDIGAMPDERVWRIWDLFFYLGQKYGIVYNGDLFTLVPEEMGDPRGWFGTVEAVSDRSRRGAQKAFLLALDRRYREVSGISWDLLNEPFQIPDEVVAEWVEDLRSALAADGSRRLITVGGPRHLPAGVDYDCPHGRLSPDYRNMSSRPVLLQELHCEGREHLAGELEQAEGFRAAAVTALRGGAAGWMPWSWSRQMRLWQDTYEHHYTYPMEKFEDRLGMHTHDDGTLKPAGLVFKDLAVLLADIHPVAYDPQTRRVTTTTGVLTARLVNETGGGHEILHTDGTRFLAGMAKDEIVLNGRPLVRGPAEAYLFLRVSPGDFATAPEVLVKSESPGNIVVGRSGAVAAELIDLTPTVCRVLERIPFSTVTGATEVRIAAEMTPYWLRLRFVK